MAWRVIHDLVTRYRIRFHCAAYNVEGAQQLWERDKYHFQKWAVELAEGFVTNRRTADGGIDGRIYFDGDKGDNLESMILEVKGGKSVSQNDLRELRGALTDSGALLAGLIILHYDECRGAAAMSIELWRCRAS